MLGLCFSYFFWHYTRALAELLGICRNLLWFVYHFFSLGVLGKTLFSPWQKLDEPYKKGFRPSAFFETFVINIVMRIVGFLVRSFVIIFGATIWLIVLIAEAVFFLSWLLLPLVIVVFIVSGVRLMLK